LSQIDENSSFFHKITLYSINKSDILRQIRPAKKTDILLFNKNLKDFLGVVGKLKV